MNGIAYSLRYKKGHICILRAGLEIACNGGLALVASMAYSPLIETSGKCDQFVPPFTF